MAEPTITVQMAHNTPASTFTGPANSVIQQITAKLKSQFAIYAKIGQDEHC